jgi:D-amino-acid dehydrogenase
VTERVIVVGGGIAGLTVAYFLRRGGAEVTVVDRGPIGGGASAGNAGWVCPAQAGPLPEPGLTAYGLRSLVQRDAPLYFAPGSCASHGTATPPTTAAGCARSRRSGAGRSR